MLQLFSPIYRRWKDFSSRINFSMVNYNIEWLLIHEEGPLVTGQQKCAEVHERRAQLIFRLFTSKDSAAKRYQKIRKPITPERVFPNHQLHTSPIQSGALLVKWLPKTSREDQTLGAKVRSATITNVLNHLIISLTKCLCNTRAINKIRRN